MIARESGANDCGPPLSSAHPQKPPTQNFAAPIKKAITVITMMAFKLADCSELAGLPAFHLGLPLKCIKRLDAPFVDVQNKSGKVEKFAAIGQSSGESGWHR